MDFIPRHLVSCTLHAIYPNKIRYSRPYVGYLIYHLQKYSCQVIWLTLMRLEYLYYCSIGTVVIRDCIIHFCLLFLGCCKVSSSASEPSRYQYYSRSLSYQTETTRSAWQWRSGWSCYSGLSSQRPRSWRQSCLQHTAC